MKLKYRLEIFEKAIAFQILEMDERFRSVSCMRQYQNVYSDVGPALTNTSFHLRGRSKVLDFEICTKVFTNNSNRDECVVKLHESLKNWADNWAGWNNNSEVVSEEKLSGIFTLE